MDKLLCLPLLSKLLVEKILELVVHLLLLHDTSRLVVGVLGSDSGLAFAIRDLSFIKIELLLNLHLSAVDSALLVPFKYFSPVVTPS